MFSLLVHSRWQTFSWHFFNSCCLVVLVTLNSEDDSVPVHVALRCSTPACVRYHVYTTRIMGIFTILKPYFHHKNVSWFQIYLDRRVLMIVKCHPIQSRVISPLNWQVISVPDVRFYNGWNSNTSALRNVQWIGLETSSGLVYSGVGNVYGSFQFEILFLNGTFQYYCSLQIITQTVMVTNVPLFGIIHLLFLNKEEYYCLKILTGILKWLMVDTF